MKFVSIKDYVNMEKLRIKEKLAASEKKYRLDIYQVNHDPASDRYVRNKMKDCDEVGIETVLHPFDYISDQYDAQRERELIREIIRDMTCTAYNTDGVLLQLPLPGDIDANRIIKVSCYSNERVDVDGFVFPNHDPCTARGIIDWLEFNNYDLEGKNAVVIGRSDIVGKPMARMLTDRNATVTLCHSHTPQSDLWFYCGNADLIISAVGKPKFLNTADFATYKTMIVDVGINFDEDGKMCGDVESSKAIGNYTYVTPVPGGVGLLTRLALIKNVIGE